MVLYNKDDFFKKLDEFIVFIQSGGNQQGVIQLPELNVDFYLTNTPKKNCINYHTSLSEAKDIVSVIDQELNLTSTGNREKIESRAKEENVDLTSDRICFISLSIL